MGLSQFILLNRGHRYQVQARKFLLPVPVHLLVLGLELASDCRHSELRKQSHIFCSGILVSPESNSENPLYTDLKVKCIHKGTALLKLSCIHSYLDVVRCLPVIYCFQGILSRCMRYICSRPASFAAEVLSYFSKVMATHEGIAHSLEVLLPH